MNKKECIELISKQRIVPLFYHDDKETCFDVIKVLYNEGITAIEFTNRGAQALENLKFLKEKAQETMPSLQLGAGTIKTLQEAKDFIEAGASFIVSPILNEDVGKFVHEGGLLWIPGCMSPTEIFAAEVNNAGIIKIFPGNVLGAGYISSIKDLFPNQLFMPTGGVEVNETNLKAWFNAGVCAVGTGSKLISKRDMDEKNFSNITSLTKKAMQIVSAL